jgi:hypothetical protein
MKLVQFAAFLIAGSLAFAASPAPGVVRGTIKKIDTKARQVVVKTAEGTEHVLELAATTTVHGTETAAKESWNGLKEGPTWWCNTALQRQEGRAGD